MKETLVLIAQWILTNCMDSKERPTFIDIMLLLLQNDKTLLAIPEDAFSTHPHANWSTWSYKCT